MCIRDRYSFVQCADCQYFPFTNFISFGSSLPVHNSKISFGFSELISKQLVNITVKNNKNIYFNCFIYFYFLMFLLKIIYKYLLKFVHLWLIYFKNFRLFINPFHHRFRTFFVSIGNKNLTEILFIHQFNEL